MRDAEIKPTKARMVGNVLANFDEIIEENPFENFHIINSVNGTLDWQGNKKVVRRLESVQENLILTVVGDSTINPNTSSTNNSAYIVIKCQKEDGTLIPNHHVRIYEKKSLIGEVVTKPSGSNMGKASFYYSSPKGGVHTLTITTVKENGFNPTTSYHTVTVRSPIYLSITPEMVSMKHGETQVLNIQANDDNGNRVSEKEIVIKEGNRTLTTATTDENGVVRYIYSESENRGRHTKITTNNPLWYRGETSSITGVLSTREGTPIGNSTIELIEANKSKTVASATTNSSGEFSLNYAPSLTTSNYYVAYYSTVNDSSNNQYSTYEPCLKDMGTLTATIPRINMAWTLYKINEAGTAPIELDYPTLTGGNSILQLFGENDYYINGTKKTATPISILKEKNDANARKQHQFALGINSLNVLNIDVRVTLKLNDNSETEITNNLYDNGIDRFTPYYLQNTIPSNFVGKALYTFYFNGTEGIFKTDTSKGYGMKFSLLFEYTS